MSKIARIRFGTIARRAAWGGPQIEVYEDDVATFEDGDLIYFGDEDRLRVWPHKPRYPTGTPIYIDGREIESIADWLAPLRTLKPDRTKPAFVFVFEFLPDHPLAASLLGYEPPARWAAVRAAVRTWGTTPCNLAAVFTRVQGHQRCLTPTLLREPRDPVKIANFFDQAEKRASGGVGKLRIYIDARASDSEMPIMSLATGWKCTAKNNRPKFRYIDMRGPLGTIDYQTLFIERRITQPFQIWYTVEPEINSYAAVHNLMVDLQMALGSLEFPLDVIMWIADFLPDVHCWSAAVKMKALISTRESMRNVKQGVFRADRLRVFNDRRRLTDVRWYERSRRDAPVVYNWPYPGYNLPDDFFAPQHQQPAQKRASSSSEHSAKKANTASN